MLLLALETAYDVCSVALFDGAASVAHAERKTPRQHNIFLAELVGECLAGAGHSFKDLDALAVSTGPGSYTGLRIGNSYAKGLALGAQLPIIPVPTLPALALSAENAALNWVVTWSHGNNLYVMPINAGQSGAVNVMTWDEFVPLAQGTIIGGYQLERFAGAPELDIVELCPSALNVGKFTILNGLIPTEDISNLLPYYYQNIQIDTKKNVNT